MIRMHLSKPLNRKILKEICLPTARIVGGKVYPNRRKRKNLKALILGSSEYLDPVNSLIREGLTTKDNLIVFQRELNKQLRIETDGFNTLGGRAFESVMENQDSELLNVFPFEIIYLDFPSQEPEPIEGRAERELESIEYTISTQVSKDSKCFGLIYTSIIDSFGISPTEVFKSSSKKYVDGWYPKKFDGFGERCIEFNESVKLVDAALMVISKKYGYTFTVVGQIRENLKNTEGAFVIGGYFTQGDI